jgi:hypothetical protein
MAIESLELSEAFRFPIEIDDMDVQGLPFFALRLRRAILVACQHVLKGKSALTGTTARLLP